MKQTLEQDTTNRKTKAMTTDEIQEKEFRLKSYLRGYNTGFKEGYAAGVAFSKGIPKWIPARRHITFPTAVVVNTGYDINFRCQVNRGEYYIFTEALLQRIPKLGQSIEEII